MRKLSLLLAVAVQIHAAITVSGVTATYVSHGSALISFSAANPSPNGDGTLWNYARICWSTTAGACAAKSGQQSYMPTSYPANAGSVSLRQIPAFSIILTGLTPGSTIEACPELSNDKVTWSTDVCTTFSTPARAAGTHPALATLPRTTTIPTVPSDYTGFRSGSSTGQTTPGAITSCANLNADYRAAVGNQTSFGTVISLSPGQGNKCSGRFFPTGNPGDVRSFSSASVSTSTNQITLTSHGFTEGHGVQFSQTYTTLPGEHNTTAASCTGIKPGQVYYAHVIDANNFQITCDYPYPTGPLMQFADSGGGGSNMFVAPYPRRKDQGGSLYPIIIRTSTPDSQLPPSGTRLDGPTWTGKLAVIQPDSRCAGPTCYNADTGYVMRNFALSTGDESDDGNKYLNANIWFVGLEIQSIDATGDVSADPLPTWHLLEFREGTSDNGVDRCYIHGQYPFPSRLAHGIVFEGHNNAILNSYFDRITYPFYNAGDTSYQTEGTQFITADVGPGPDFFYNNFLQTTGNGFHFSAAGDNGFANKIIQDVVIQRSTFTQNPPTSHQQYCYGNPGSDGWEYRNRQPLEFKGGYRILLDGDIFEYDCHFLASAALALTSVTAGLSDLTITNNTWRHVSSVGMMGSCTQGGPPVCQSPTNRYTYKNNLSWDVDGYTYTDHYSGAWPGGWRGWIIQTAQDGEDFIWDHNTVVSAQGTNASQFYLASGGAEGFQFTNSIFQANSDTNAAGNGARIDGVMNADEAIGCSGGVQGSAYAEALLTCSWRYPGAIVSGNLVTSDSLDSTQITAAWPSQKQPCDSAGNNCNPANLNLVGWTQHDYTKPSQDFRLRANSPYISGGPRPASDKYDIGADIVALEKAQGRVYFNSVVPTSTTAIVAFVAPDTQACPVDWSSTDSTLVNAFTRTTDLGTAAGPRTVTLTGLTPRTDYYFRINCAVQQPRGTFHTN
jgi:hypothetical protein